MRPAEAVRELARRRGVQLAYRDVGGIARRARTEPLCAVLRALGEPVDRPETAVELLRRNDAIGEPIEPVYVAWDGRLPPFEATLPGAPAAERWMQCELVLEDGSGARCDVRRCGATGGGGTRLWVQTADRLPPGYHRLRLTGGRQSVESMIISAPSQAPGGNRRSWGVFAPLYAVRSSTDWGCGDLGELAGLVEWTAELGGGTVATLPLLARGYDEPFDASPYSALSRVFWDEMYLDVPAWRQRESAGDPGPGDREQCRRLEALRDSELVDHQGVMATKREVLWPMAQRMYERPGARRELLEAFVSARPEVESYARFRAARARHGRAWTRWPEGAATDGDPEARYHLYVQWAMAEQLAGLRAEAERRGVELYLDYPVGVAPDGFDVWREGALFAADASMGAPPDGFFTRGQDWGVPPMRPDDLRRQGYRYWIETLRAHLQYARRLRIDHVMGLHRLYWVPDGFPATDGVYVRYAADELYAILALEAHRHDARIVGENLGTVPSYVDRELRRRRVARMYVLPFAMDEASEEPVRPPPADAVAGLNTHDMPPFAAFWHGDDLALQRELGGLDSAGESAGRRGRARMRKRIAHYLAGLYGAGDRPHAILRALLRFLGESPAELVVVNIEDLWLESRPQNVPGTGVERPNWRRKFAHTLDSFTRDARVRAILKTLHQSRLTGSRT